MLTDPAFWTGVASGVASTALVALLRGAGRVILSWLGLARVGRAWGSRTTWRLHRVADDEFHAVLTFCENPVVVTAITPVSGLARWAEVNPPGTNAETDDELPKTIDAGERLRFTTRLGYDERLWLRGFVYEVAWFETVNGKRRGFRAKARVTFPEPPLA